MNTYITAHKHDIVARFKLKADTLDKAKFRIEKLGFTIISSEEL